MLVRFLLFLPRQYGVADLGRSPKSPAMIFEVLSFSLPKNAMIGQFQSAFGFCETGRLEPTSVLKFSFGRLVFPTKVCAAFLARVGDLAGETGAGLRIFFGTAGLSDVARPTELQVCDGQKWANQALEPTAIIRPPAAHSLAPLAHL
jgi:hypothetical protein